MQRLLPDGHVTRSAPQQLQPVPEPLDQRLRREQAEPGGGELDGERQAVQAQAELGDGLCILSRQSKVGLDRGPGLTKVCYPYVTTGERVNPAYPE